MRPVDALLQKVNDDPQGIEFTEVMECIAQTYVYSPCAFQCGDIRSDAGSNEGSCKVLAFAKLNKLDAAETLALFGQFYRSDVLGNPTGDDHANIRNFVKYGWAGVSFDSVPLRHYPKL